MEAKRPKLQKVCALCVLAIILLTLLSFFIAPPIKDAITRKNLGLPDDAFVTDTARDPWIYVNEKGELYLNFDKTPTVTEVVLPDAVNGVRLKRFVGGSHANIKKLTMPKYLTVNEEMTYMQTWDYLETIIFPEGVEDISKLDVFGMPVLTAVYLPRSLKSIYGDIFRRCEDATLYYAGTEEEWLAMGKSARELLAKRRIVFETPVPES